MVFATGNHLAAQGTAFTYQGRLLDNGQPVNGTNYGMVFYVYDTPTNGSPLGNFGIASVTVSNGLFTVPLDFGNVFDGNPRWLEVSVEKTGPGGDGGLTTLAPRQQMLPTPYAIQSLNASNLLGNVSAAQVSGQISTEQLPTVVVTNNQSGVNFSGAFSGNGGGLTNVNAANLTGTISVGQLPTNVLINGNGLTIQQGTSGEGAPNIVAGSPGNFVAAGVVGATISGGGATNYDGFAYTNSVSASFSTIGGGEVNTIQPDASDSTVGGGYANTIQSGASDSTIGGGYGNAIRPNAAGSVIGGGEGNIIQTNAWGSTIGGGGHNSIQIYASDSLISGGYGNTIQTNVSDSTLGGGEWNMIQSYARFSTLGGGEQNTIWTNASHSTLGGGFGNVVAGQFGTIPGGYENQANGNYSFAAGRYAHANHDGAFVWADDSPYDFYSVGTNVFQVRATGGVRFVTAIDGNGNSAAGVSLAPGGGSWASLSDRNAKENFTPVNPEMILARVVSLPLTTWSYKTENGVRHIGPMAQDFYAAFNVGEDNRHIADVDEGGVALAAIQGLNKKMEKQLKTRDAEIEQLQQTVAQLKAAMNKLASKQLSKQ